MSRRQWKLLEWSVKAVVISVCVVIVVRLTCDTPSGGDVLRTMIPAVVGLFAGKVRLGGNGDA